MTPLKDRLKPDSTYKVAYGDDVDSLENPKFIIAYWSIRGLGSPIRMMLAAAQVNHWVIFYDVKEVPDGKWSKDSYLHDKSWLKEEYNPLMNLPFLVDCANGTVISQTNAILTFLGRELNMLGSNPQDQTICEELLCEVMDIRNKMVRFAYAPSTSDDKQDAETLIKKGGPVANSFDKLELCLGKKNDTVNGNVAKKTSSACLVGDSLSSPDFHLWEMLDQFEGLCKFYQLPSLLNDVRPHLTAFKASIESRPEVKTYVSSEYMKIPYNNCYARFCSCPNTLGKYQRGMKTPWKGKGVVEVRRKKLTNSGKKRKL